MIYVVDGDFKIDLDNVSKIVKNASMQFLVSFKLLIIASHLSELIYLIHEVKIIFR